MSNPPFERMLALIWLVVLFSSTACAETLRDAVERAVRTNPEVLAAGTRRLAADEAFKEARAGYLPRVDVSAGFGRERLNDLNARLLGLSKTAIEHRDASLTLSQMLFDGFAVSSAVAQQSARVESTAYGTAAAAEDIAVGTTDAYLDILRRQETVAAAIENLDAHARIHNQIRLRSESGVGRRADFDQAEARLALAQANLRTEQSGLLDAEITYLRLVGTSARGQVKPAVQEADLPHSNDEALQIANVRHPAVKAAEADVDVASAQVGVARAALSPRLDLEVTATHANDIVASRTDDVTVMLQLRYNLFRGGADQARINETHYQLDEARDLLNRTRREIDERVSLTLNSYQTSRDRLEMFQRYAVSSAETREAYAKQFSIGQRTLLDLLNAENEYFNARVSYITGQYLLLAAHFRLLASMGILLDTLGVSPPPESIAREMTKR
jgi:outer membrane protein, adhesin transport system